MSVRKMSIEMARDDAYWVAYRGKSCGRMAIARGLALPGRPARDGRRGWYVLAFSPEAADIRLVLPGADIIRTNRTGRPQATLSSTAKLPIGSGL
jgi:hypothetical protein